MNKFENEILIKDTDDILLKIKEDGVISLNKDEIEIILNNKDFFDEFVIDLAEDFYENWDEHLESQKKIESIIKEDISIIIDKKS